MHRHIVLNCRFSISVDHDDNYNHLIDNYRPYYCSPFLHILTGLNMWPNNVNDSFTWPYLRLCLLSAKAGKVCLSLFKWPTQLILNSLATMSIALSPWMRFKSIARLPSSISSNFHDYSLVPVYTPGWREVMRVFKVT